MNAETFQNLSRAKKKLLIAGGAVFAVFWIYMIASTIGGAADAKEKADTQRRRIEHSMKAQKAAEDALNRSRQNLKLPF